VNLMVINLNYLQKIMKYCLILLREFIVLVVKVNQHKF